MFSKTTLVLRYRTYTLVDFFTNEFDYGINLKILNAKEFYNYSAQHYGKMLLYACAYLLNCPLVSKAKLIISGKSDT